MPDAMRGDLIAVTTTSRDFLVGKGAYTTTRVQVGTITSITRGGIAKAWCPIGSTTPRALDPRRDTWKIIEASRVRVEGVIAMVRAHTWPGHPDQIMPFDSEAELREALQPHLKRHLPGVPIVTEFV